MSVVVTVILMITAFFLAERSKELNVREDRHYSKDVQAMISRNKLASILVWMALIGFGLVVLWTVIVPAIWSAMLN